jgi:hypothetical protein
MRLHTCTVDIVGLGYVNVRMTGEATYCTHVEKAVCGWVRLHTVHVSLAG